MQLLDVATMNSQVKTRGDYSVSKGLVYYGLPRNYNEFSVETVCCIAHGAMLCVSILRNNNKLWRCEVCNNGGIEIV